MLHWNALNLKIVATTKKLSIFSNVYEECTRLNTRLVV